MKKPKLIALIFLSVSVLTCGILSAKDMGAGIVFDEGFFSGFNAKQPIQRDAYLESLVNRIIIGRGRITSVTEKTRYKKRYRVVIESTDSVKYGQKIVFFLFLDNKNTVDLLAVDTQFEFKGQLMGVTPLTSKRNEFILDVIMMDGSTVIE